MNKEKRYTEDQILGILKEIEAGASIASVGRTASAIRPCAAGAKSTRA